MGVRQDLPAVLICVSLTTTDVGHRFMCLLAICVSSLEMSSQVFMLGCFCWSNAIFIHFQETELVNQGQILRR